jgi:4'-phosphopantetheinyl transferase
MEVEDFSDTSYMAKLLPLISLEKQDRVSRMLFEIDRKLEVYSEALLRTLICELLPIANQDIVLGKNEHGKPYLVNNPDFHFNISHTRNALAVAIGDLPVGIDIEKCQESDQSAAKRVFNSKEYAYIYSQETNVNLRFCEAWTRKEAYLKWTGEGFSLDSNRNNRENDVISVQVVSTRIGQYIISTCSESVNINSLIIHLTEQELFKRNEIICRS